MVDSPSRNDPCPCGSGKKFKRCCLQLHGPRSAPSASPGEARSLALLQAATLLVERGPRLKDVLSRLDALMGAGGPLCKIRFDWPELEEAIAHEDWTGELDDRRERVLRKVLTRPFVERAKREFHRALALEGTSPADLEAIAVGYSMLDVSLADRQSPLELNPVLKILLHVQAKERIEARGAFLEKTRGLVQAMRDRPAGASHEIDPEKLAELSELLEADGQLRARLESAAKELHKEVLASFRSDEAPQEVLTVEEHLWVLVHIDEALASLQGNETSAKAAHVLVGALAKVLDDDFHDAVAARLRARANDNSLSRDERLRWELVRSVHEAKPTVFVLALASGHKSRPLFRSQRERELHEKIDTDEAPRLLEEVRGELERAGEIWPSKLLLQLDHKLFVFEDPPGGSGSGLDSAGSR